jgi:hypothetical protein
MANRSVTCRPTEAARAFRHSDEDDSTQLMTLSWHAMSAAQT